MNKQVEQGAWDKIQLPVLLVLLGLAGATQWQWLGILTLLWFDAMVIVEARSCLKRNEATIRWWTSNARTFVVIFVKWRNRNDFDLTYQSIKDSKRLRTGLALELSIWGIFFSLLGLIFIVGPKA